MTTRLLLAYLLAAHALVGYVALEVAEDAALQRRTDAVSEDIMLNARRY